MPNNRDDAQHDGSASSSTRPVRIVCDVEKQKHRKTNRYKVRSERGVKRLKYSRRHMKASRRGTAAASSRTVAVAEFGVSNSAKSCHFVPEVDSYAR